jgi:hypothetical protein
MVYFAYPKSTLCCVFEGLGMENFSIMYGYLVYFIAIERVCGHWNIYIVPFLVYYNIEKSGNPVLGTGYVW